MTTINDEGYFLSHILKITTIKKIIVLLFSIIVFISVSNSILAILHYNSIKDTEIKNNLYYFWIMAIINILCTVLCFIIFIIFLYMYDHKNILNIYKNIIISIGIITLIISLYINISLFTYYCENKKYSNIDLIFPIITYIVYLPLWIIMLFIFINVLYMTTGTVTETVTISDLMITTIGPKGTTVTKGPQVSKTVTIEPKVSNLKYITPEQMTIKMG